MWAKCGFALVVAGLSCLPARAEGDSSIRWQTTLDSAKRLAAQSNQLVLVHFWAPWCVMCRKMEQDVFPQPRVVAAIEANYIPVKLNTDYFPATARQYGIHALPTDIIITPQGQLLHKQEGMLAADAYVDLLGQIAANAKPRPTPVIAQIAQNPTAGNSAPAYGGTAGGNAVGTQNLPGPGPAGMTPGGYWMQPGNPPFAGASLPTGPLTASTSPSVGSAGPLGSSTQAAAQPGPALSPQLGAAQGVPASAGAATTPFQWSQSGAATAPGPATQANSPANAGRPTITEPPATAGLSLPAMPGPGMAPPMSAAAPNANYRPGYGLPGGPSPATGTSKPSQPTAELPLGAPPLGLDGFCPVRLSEAQRWVRGDPRWGAIHRGRTYLFTGPEEQRKFLADPDTYAPVMSGNDIVIRVERNEQITGHREHGVFCDGKIYLFASEESLQKFDRAPARYIAEVQQVLRPSSVQR